MHHLVDARRQRVAGNGVVQPAGGTIEHIRVAEAAEAAHLVDEAVAGEGKDRVFLGIGVEVADQQHVAAAGRRLALRHIAAQAVGLLHTPQVPATLAVADVVVAAVVGIAHRRAAALALQVIDQQREALAIGQAEGLGQRGPVVDGIGVAVGQARRAQLCRLVDHGRADRIGAAALGRQADAGVAAGAHCRVQRVHQVLHGSVAVVLDFHQAQHVGVQRRHGLDDLAALAAEFAGVVGAPAVAGRHAGAQAAALAGQATGGFAIGEGGEVVQHIEAGHLEVAAHRLWRRCAGVGRAEHRRDGRVDLVVARAGGAVGGQAIVEHAGDAGHRVTGPAQAVGAQVGDGVGVLQAAAVVQQDAAAGVLVGQRDGLRRAGAVAVGGGLQAAAQRQRQLAIAALEEILVHGERAGQRHQHALVTLQIVVDKLGQRHQRGRDGPPTAQQGHRADPRQLGHGVGAGVGIAGDTGVELHHGGDDLYLVARHCCREACAAGEDEDAIGGERVAVPHRVLHEEAVVVDLGDHPAGADQRTGQRAGRG